MADVLASGQASRGFEAIRNPEPVAFPTRGQLFALLLCYFALHVVIRALLSSSVDLDESEQVLLSQKFSWGYGSDPPVYTWLQMGFFAVFGRSVFALALLKNLLLLATYWLIYESARAATRSHLCGAAAALSLAFIPQVVWESQRDLTHTILASACAVGALLCLLRAEKGRGLGWFLGFGICGGLGLLAKYNFAFWLVGVLVAALSLAEFRAKVLNMRMAAALLVCAVVFAPNGLWLLRHPELAYQTTSKLGLQGSASWSGVVLTGTRNILQAAAAFAGPLVGVYLLLFLKEPQPRTESRPGAACAKLILRAFLFIGGVLVVLVLCFRATGFRERWFQPILICAPVLGITLLRNRVEAVRVKWLATLALATMLLITLGIPARIVFAERMKREEPLNRPYAELARQMRPALPESSMIVAESVLLGGNLLLALPGETVVTPPLAGLLGKRAEHCFLVWDATEGPHRERPPRALTNWAQPFVTADLAKAQRQYFSAVYKFHHERQRRLGLLKVY